MSAREELFRRVSGSFVDENRANKLIDDLLHEEAEKIRHHKPDPEPIWWNSDEYHDGVETSADLIDPYSS